MSTVTSEQIQNLVEAREPLTIDTPELEALTDRPIGVSDLAIVLSSEHTAAIERLASASIKAFGVEEPTLVATKHGIATLLTRIDCTITPDGVKLYECEERPAGIGITHVLVERVDGRGIMPRIREHFHEHVDGVPQVLRHPDAKPNDDSLVLPVQELSDRIPAGPLLIRGEPEPLSEHEQLDTMTDQAVATIVTKGDKRYLLVLPESGTTVAHLEAITPDKSFVIKPVKGSKARGVTVYLTPEDKRIHGDHKTVTFERARRTLAAAPAGSMLFQEFVPPILTRLPSDKVGNMILRVFTLVHPDGHCEAIGGTYVTRRELVVHGASDAICGAVLV